MRAAAAHLAAAADPAAAAPVSGIKPSRLPNPSTATPRVSTRGSYGFAQSRTDAIQAGTSSAASTRKGTPGIEEPAMSVSSGVKSVGPKMPQATFRENT